MSKYDKMLSVNKQRSEEKIATARKAIYELLEKQERISVPKLMKMTGLSRGFFYKNTEVRREMDLALERQAGVIDKRRGILDIAMDKQIETLQYQIAQLQAENEELKKKNLRLQKALNKRDLNLAKNL
ncbi:DUF6262 family protein [Faecalimonas umbilicata]|nr:DUF6262 family protein [Faecalimonas umbilicata]